MTLRVLGSFLSCLLVSCTKPHKNPYGFEIEEGLAIKMVASEPLIADPVYLEFNEKGNAMLLGNARQKGAGPIDDPERPKQR